MLWIYCIKIYSLFIIYSVSLFNCYNLKRVNISHFKAVDSRRFCYFYIFTNFPTPGRKVPGNGILSRGFPKTQEMALPITPGVHRKRPTSPFVMHKQGAMLYRMAR